MESTTKKAEIQFKLLLLGDQAVGKSSIMMRYTDNEFNLNIMGTAGVDLKKKNLVINGENVKVMIYDTAGHERFRLIAKTQYKGSNGIVLIYDVTDKKSFDNISYWMNHITDHAETDREILLVGNKIDKLNERVVITEEGTALADKFGVPFIETSAKTGENIEDAFLKLNTNIYNKEKAKTNVVPIETLNNNKKDKKKTQSKCCS
jgi:small GTP-binding protein